MPRTVNPINSRTQLYRRISLHTNYWRKLAIYLIPGNLFLAIFSMRAMFEINGRRYFSFFDDALISMSYGRTLSEGHGLVWYPGAPQVQGFTNPLWTFLFAGLHYIFDSFFSVGLAYLVICFFLINGIAILTERLLSIYMPVESNLNWVPIVVASTIPFQYSFTYWTLRGMEVGFLGFCLILMVLCTIKMRGLETHSSAKKYWYLWAAAAVLGVLTRMDFLLFAVINLLLLGRRKSNGGGIRANSRQILLGLSLLITFSVILLSQKIYYGDFLPNTYTLKMTGFSLNERLSRGLIVILKTYSGPLLFILASLTIVFKKGLQEKTRELAKILLANLSVIVFYSVWVGGDAWEGIGKINRYLSVAQPILICLIAIVITSFTTNSIRFQRSFLVLVSASAITFGLGVNPFRFALSKSLPLILAYSALSVLIFISMKHSFFKPLSLLLTLVLFTNVVAIGLWVKRGGLEFLDREDRNIYLLGEDISRVLKPTGKAAVLWAGGPIYYSKRGGIDLLGKNDKLVANEGPNRSVAPGVWNSTFYPGHNKWNYDYSIGTLKPDMVAQYWGDISEKEFTYWGYKECDFNNSTFWLLSKSDEINWDNVKRCT